MKPAMPTLLLATATGCILFTNGQQREVELPGHRVEGLVPEADGSCLAIVDERQIWRRSPNSTWSQIASADIALQSLTTASQTLFVGAMDEASMLRLSPNGNLERLQSFEATAGRNEWFAVGPPLGVRSLAATANGATLLAAVHVGGIPISSDAGESWTPTLPVLHDVHEVRTHPDRSTLAAAAAAVGLCISNDGGHHWTVYSEGLPASTSLAVAVLPSEVLFSVQDSPFAKRSQLWRWTIDAKHIEQVRDGLPEWMHGKIDTGWIAPSQGRAAVVDAGGNLWLSTTGSSGWKQIANTLPHCLGLAILSSSASLY